MRKLIWPVLFLLFLSLQMSLPQYSWFKFDLPLIFVYCYAMLYGSIAGTVTGFAAGAVQDFLTGGIFGFHILTRTAIGYYVGYTKEKVFKESLFYNVFAIFAVTLVVRSFYFLVQMLMAKGFSLNLLAIAMEDFFAYCLGNIFFIIPVFLIMGKLKKWINSYDGLH